MALHEYSLAALNEIRTRGAGSQKVVFVSGNFNIVHPGHLRLIRFAKECGDYLVVGVSGDSSESILPEQLRYDGVRNISSVDYAFILKDTPEAFITELKPYAVVKGKEHEATLNPEQTALDQFGGKLIFSSGEAVFSSIDLLKKEFKETNLSTIVKPSDFPKRHGFTTADLSRALAKLNGLRVTVIGDLIIDEYVTCDPLGMSQEDPTIVVSPISYDKFIGGAAIVAAHAKSLGADVRFFSVSGKDASVGFATEKLAEYGVKAQLFEDESRPTSLKQRFRANGKTLLRVSHLKQHDITQQLARKMATSIVQAVKNSDLVIFSDFNYGCLPQGLVDRIIAACEESGVPTVGDSQSSSQVGDVSRFHGTMLLTPTEREARLATRNFNSGLVVLAETLRKQAKAKNIVITLGAEGLLIHAAVDTRKKAWLTDRLPAFNTAPKDSAGAGDSFLTCSSMALASGTDIWQSTYLGCIAAACQIGRIGNIPLSPDEIRREIDL